ncbi:MAG: hypothetical protein ACR2MO_17005 [Acidimicrobiales bacterium]
MPNENVTVNRAAPTIVTLASDAVVLGGSVRDTATLSGGASPTGTITFNVFGPDNATCSGTPASTSTRTVSDNGSYTSDPYTPAATGRYRFVATYSGDANNAPAGPTACDDPNEDVDVTPVGATTTTTSTPGATTTTPGTQPPAVLGTQLTLPRTGAGVAAMSLVALIVMLSGGLLTVVTLRRRVTPEPPPEG